MIELKEGTRAAGARTRTRFIVDEGATTTLGNGEPRRDGLRQWTQLLADGIQLRAKRLELRNPTIDLGSLLIDQLSQLEGVGPTLRSKGSLHYCFDLGQGQPQQPNATNETQTTDVVGSIESIP
jgi:hypothetical protein